MWNDIRYAARSLTKSRGFTIVAITTLALGIGANSAIFSLIKGAYFEGLPYPRSHEILTMGADFSQLAKSETPISGPEFLALQERSHLLRNVTALVGASFNLTGEGDAVRFRGLRAMASLFPMLEVQPLLGRVFTADEERPGSDRVVVISYQLWQRALGGAPSVIGRDLRLNDQSYTIIGVMPRRFLYGDCDIWVPLSLDLARQPRSDRNIYCHARIASGSSLTAVNIELNQIARDIEKDFGAAAPEYAHWQLKAKRLIDDVVRDLKSALGILMGTVVCVLLITCANISNLQLARNVMRQKEIALRLALGARRSDIIRQLLIESGLLALIGGAAGVVLAAWSLRPILSLVPYSYIPIEAEVRIDQTVLFITLGVTVLTAILFGLLPAWRAARPDLNDSLREARRGGGSETRHRRVQRFLVVSQVALTFVLLISAALMIKSFARLQQVDAGFDPERLVKMDIALPQSRYSSPEPIRAFFEGLLGKIRNIPGVQAASAVTILPLALFPDSTLISIEGRSQDELGGAPMAEQRQITPEYLKTLNIPLQQGRDITERDNGTAPRVALVNQALVAKYFPKGDAIGQHIRLGQNENDNAWSTIVGIVKNVRQLNMTDPVSPEVYQPHAQVPDASRRMALVIRTSLDQASLLNQIRDFVRTQDAGAPVFEVQSMDEFMAHAFGGARFTVFLLGLFGALALALTLTGIYGVVAYFVAHRTGEIGIRMALGAQRHHILQLVLGQGVSMVVVGTIAGIGGALAATRLLRSLLFQVSSTDWSVYLLVGLSLGLATICACYVPARSAMRLNPVEALHYE
jgi:putative ABC transport system permease protein